MADIRPDQNILHNKKVSNIEDKNKTFTSKEGTRSKYVISFEDGYKAEYCPIQGQYNTALHNGKFVSFKIKYRKEFGDEIDILNVSDAAEKKVTSPGISSQIVNMNGHPATIALMAAREIHTTKMNNANKSEYEEIMISDMLDDADTIHEWLLKKATNDD